jgi:hypothetical protein
MNDDLYLAVLHSIESWAEQCDDAAVSGNPVQAIRHIANNLRMARLNLETLRRRRVVPDAESKADAFIRTDGSW